MQVLNQVAKPGFQPIWQPTIFFKKSLSEEFKIVDALGISFFPNASCTLIFAHFACGISQKEQEKVTLK